MGFRDFDAAWAEQAAQRAEAGDEPPPREQVKVLGEMWDLPARMPAAVIIRGARLIRGGERALSQAEIIAFASDLVPGPVLEAWLDRGIEIEQLEDVVRYLLPIYMGLESGDGEGGAAGPEASPSSGPSSPDGPASKPTSNASTATTSTS